MLRTSVVPERSEPPTKMIGSGRLTLSVSGFVDDEVALIAVVGPAAHDLLEPFAAHYRSLGVTEWRVAVHLPAETPRRDRRRLLAVCRDVIGQPEFVSEGEWLVPTNGILRDQLRARARAEWHLVADADEFQSHPGGLPETIARCRAEGIPFATGLFVDRLSAGDELPAAGRTPAALDSRFPLGSFLTAEILEGDPRKVTLAHRDVEIGSNGNHFTANDPVIETPAPLPVHHFKWRAGVREYLEDRVRSFEHRTDAEHGVRLEAQRALTLLRAAPRSDEGWPATFPASLGELPTDWAAISEPIWRYWQLERRRARRSYSTPNARAVS